ncbi:phage holin family protein [Alteribacter natronophilus]|uniref:phage holin family protein n=1 Tax=Alteribacter natronophilus TaxID=2583810 RepID=UPI00110E89E4|nr:phage holin family protein [Alteribacter natronophilus]TMW71687.1 holin [Alteribacter natronophilus]
MELLQFVVDDALILIPVLMIFGKLLKQTPWLSDWVIPYILLAAGIILTGMLLGFSFSSFIQGVLVTGAAVFGHQLIRQTQKGKKAGFHVRQKRN